jgi:hypothetical protein
MKEYQETKEGNLTTDNMTIPATHGLYRIAQEEVAAGEAEILPYTKPVPTKAELDALHLATLTDTDWYVVRAFETGVPVPQHILDARESARRSI